jgi:hypothetical protein
MHRTLLLLALGLTLLAPATTAHAADTNAPPSARLDWLPADEWVMSSWLPFSEEELHTELRTSRRELGRWLNDRRTLGQLARRRGHRSLSALAVRLAGPGASAVRRRRALTMLTQAHLANHVLFHVFHTPAIASAAPRVFGVRPATFRALRAQGLSPAAIGARGGRSRAAVRGSLRRLLRTRADRGVRVGAMTRTQAGALLRVQEDGLRAYVVRPFRTLAQHRAFLCRVR